MVRYPLLSRPVRPFFEQILLGTDEENFVRNVTLPPTFKHHSHALTHEDFWNTNKKRKQGLCVAVLCCVVLLVFL